MDANQQRNPVEEPNQIPLTKTSSVFYRGEFRERLRDNIERVPWAKAVAEEIVADARPWMEMSDDELWSLMFGPSIDRSWMVWSNGHCPSCGRNVPMYQWKIDAPARPWKVACPHCGEIFPKNDFEAYYRSGLNERGLFDPKLADRGLLFNDDHPEPNDPLLMFGVDDGYGYMEDGKRWRFIGAYLVYGQWKQAILGGINALAAAHVVSGDPVAARKAAIMLDRVADVYPEFDFKTQAWVYERRDANGYVSTWHDACEETRELALAYDRIFDAIRGDRELVAFLKTKAEQYASPNPKASFEDIQRNIEERIFRDALINKHKIHSNYPRQEIAITVMDTVMGWPYNRKQVMDQIGAIVRRSTEIDGVTGEKGLAGYSSFVIQSLADFLGQYDRLDPDVLSELLREHSSLHKTWRFFIDTWCLQSYYPAEGDSLWFATKAGEYRGVRFNRGSKASLEPSPYTFLWRLYEITGDPSYVQALYSGNGYKLDNLPKDLFIADSGKIRKEIADIIEDHGSVIELGSVDKEQWHLAILRSGSGDNARALWFDYDSGGQHAHFDGMNIGLFAHGLDFLPDFGYPPVQFGGWGSPRARWYGMTAAHNTVVVDGRDQAGARFGGRPVAGKVTLWADGRFLRAVRAEGAAIYPAKPEDDFEGCSRYERTVGIIDLPNGENFYVFDVFRVVGGRDHAKFISSHFGSAVIEGLTLGPSEEYGYGAQTRNFRMDPNPAPVWSATWTIDDRHNYLKEGEQARFRYTDLTFGAEAGMGEAWVAEGGFGSDKETWIPRLMIRRRNPLGGLESTFVAIMEPFGEESAIASVRRLPLTLADGTNAPDSAVAIEVLHAGGGRDLIVCAPSEGLPADDNVLIQADWDISLAGGVCLARADAEGTVLHVSSSCADQVRVGEIDLRAKAPGQLLEWSRENIER